MKKTAKAPSNIAFIKYWGKSDEELRTPLNSSLSMNLSGAYTLTTVEFLKSLTADDIHLVNGEFSEKEIGRIVKGLDRIRNRVGEKRFARLFTQNTFPKGTGAAASASGFAALTVAAYGSLGVDISGKEMSIVARLGSGSACRSIPDGYVVWEKGNSSESSFAYSIFPHTHWDLRDALVVVDSRMKKVSTTDGMERVGTSPLLTKRLGEVDERIVAMKSALERKDMKTLGTLIEADCLDMHAVMQSQDPPLLYWNEQTIKIMDRVRKWREEGLPVYFTIDAGPNVHLIYEGQNHSDVVKKLGELEGVESIVYNEVSAGTHLCETHLF